MHYFVLPIPYAQLVPTNYGQLQISYVLVGTKQKNLKLLLALTCRHLLLNPLSVAAISQANGRYFIGKHASRLWANSNKLRATGNYITNRKRIQH